MDELRVRAYNVRFGDAILITVPDQGADGDIVLRHILIDVGNVLAGSGGQDDVFEPVIQDILDELNGHPLDLYVMTHEHMDHVQGLLWAREKRGLDISASHAWLTASAAPDYYDRFPEARRKRLALELTYQRIERYLGMTGKSVAPVTAAMMLNNNPRRTLDCVEHLRGICPTPTYVSRSTDVSNAHPFNEVSFDIWGPEEDTSIYYGPFRPMALGEEPAGGLIAGSRLRAAGDPPAAGDQAAAGEQGAAGDQGAAGGSDAEASIATPLPPPGVDAGAFYELVSLRRRGLFDNLLAIDRAANDSSIVFVMEWRGWRLLFPGDAEERSWKEMNKRNLLSPVHFLKVGHHGSHNGTPADELLDSILPLPAPDVRPRFALVSTHEGTYNNVPDAATLDELRRRCTVSRIGEANDDLFTDTVFPA